jgi:hypothetical protein
MTSLASASATLRGEPASRARVAAVLRSAAGAAAASWNDGPSKQQILKFVADVTTPGSSAFVPAEDRIAVFDNDGTLWAEQPLYFQFVFCSTS